MVDPDKVRALLRDIKGIFEIEGVHFLVSVSHEAARALKLGGLAERNEFTSSFYTAIELPPLSARDCAELLEARERLGRRDRLTWLEREGRTDDAALDRLRAAVAEPPPVIDDQRRRWAAIGVLAGGNPRETIRLADVVGESRTDADAPHPADAAIAAILRAELLEFRREAIASVSHDRTTRLSDDELSQMYRKVSELTADDEQLLAAARTAIRDLWSPAWARHAWYRLLGEDWRRLVVRLQAGGLLSSPAGLDPATQKRLAEIVAEASLSATAARLALDDEPFSIRLDAGEAAERERRFESV